MAGAEDDDGSGIDRERGRSSCGRAGRRIETYLRFNAYYPSQISSADLNKLISWSGSPNQDQEQEQEQ